MGGGGLEIKRVRVPEKPGCELRMKGMSGLTGENALQKEQPFGTEDQIVL